MSQLNNDAAQAMNEVGAHACVDVTGFGLLGHLRGMTRASERRRDPLIRRHPLHTRRDPTRRKTA